MNAVLHRLLIAAGLLLTLGAVNVTVWQREQLIDSGQVVMLELAQVDPRSLMQGDYMALRFALSRDVLPDSARARPRRAAEPAEWFATDGYVVVKRDARNIGKFARLWHEGETLAADESRLRYRVREQDVRIVTNAWFFKEGTGAVFTPARYGELRVADNGEALLVAMRDKDLKLLEASDGKTKP